MEKNDDEAELLAAIKATEDLQTEAAAAAAFADLNKPKTTTPMVPPTPASFNLRPPKQADKGKDKGSTRRVIKFDGEDASSDDEDDKSNERNTTGATSEDISDMLRAGIPNSAKTPRPERRRDETPHDPGRDLWEGCGSRG